MLATRRLFGPSRRHARLSASSKQEACAEDTERSWVHSAEVPKAVVPHRPVHRLPGSRTTTGRPGAAARRESRVCYGVVRARAAPESSKYVTLREDLATGRAGVRWSPPASFVWREDHPDLALVQDVDRQVAWLVRRFRWRLDLRRAYDEVLRRDLEEDARYEFESNFKPVETVPGSGQTSRPRTSDPRWSPIVEVEHQRIGEAPALRVVRRLSYQPGMESVSGALLVPVAHGFVEVAAIVRAGMTGYRESALMLRRSGGLPGPEEPFPAQAEFDDERHDASFPQHPLSLTRRAMRWLLADAALEVTEAAGEPPEGEVTVAPARCAVFLPPRYLFVPREVLPMSPTLASYSRVGLADGDPRLLDVWRVPNRLIGDDRGRKLRDLAVTTINDWAKEGATDIEQSPRVVSGDDAPVSVTNLVRFNVGGVRKVSAMRWRADDDGTVFRVAVSAAPYVPASDLVEQADTVMGCLGRVVGAPPERMSQESKKPWWKPW